ELRGRWQMLNAVATLRSERPESDGWHSDGVVNELYASGEAAGWQFSAGRKIVAWDVGYAFRPNDIVQQEKRRTLLPFTPEGRALGQAEYFTASTAWSLVWVNPQRAFDDESDPAAMGAEEQALAARVFRHIGEADWHGFARWGQHTRVSLGGAVSWVASDSLEVHASARWAERADVLAFPAAIGLATSSPFAVVTRNNCAQALLGATWTAENKLSLMAELWYDGTAASNAQWDDWFARNAQLAQTGAGAVPQALRRGVAGNLAWQAQAFGGQSLRRSNVFVRASWEHEGWQPSLDLLYMPADHGRMVTAALGWQGDRVRADVGLRVNGGPDDSVAAQLPVGKQAYAAVTWAF
ncbi:MAG TPA: hypothetical protein VHQ87_15240, partial [Rhizobacter sp.]|nr:hypothetical protein [Rhizobacter sp.]